MLKNNMGYEELSKRILEVNSKHPLIQKLQNAVSNDGNEEAIENTAWLLLDQAKIIEGETLSDPKAFVDRMSKLASLQF
jgi:molecular chaperone HtpG